MSSEFRGVSLPKGVSPTGRMPAKRPKVGIGPPVGERGAVLRTRGEIAQLFNIKIE